MVHHRSVCLYSMGSVQNIGHPGSEDPAPVVSSLANLPYYIGISDRLLRTVIYKVRPKSFETSCFKRVLCVTSSGRHRNYVVLCFM